MKSDMERLLEGSNTIEAQKTVIADQAATIKLLEARIRILECRLSRRTTIDLSVVPALLRKQAG